MVPQILLEIGQAEQQLEQFLPLRWGMPVAVLRERLHDKVGICQQPVERLRIHRATLLAEFDGRMEARENLLDIVVQAQRFLYQRAWNLNRAPDHPTGTKRGLHLRTPPQGVRVSGKLTAKLPQTVRVCK